MPTVQLRGVPLDCADPQALSAFYGALIGMSEQFCSDELDALTGCSGVSLGFQRVFGYLPPQWPGQDVPQQLHLDLRTDDLDATEAQALQLGPTRPSELSRGDR